MPLNKTTTRFYLQFLCVFSLSYSDLVCPVCLIKSSPPLNRHILKTKTSCQENSQSCLHETPKYRVTSLKKTHVLEVMIVRKLFSRLKIVASEQKFDLALHVFEYECQLL